MMSSGGGERDLEGMPDRLFELARNWDRRLAETMGGHDGPGTQGAAEPGAVVQTSAILALTVWVSRLPVAEGRVLLAILHLVRGGGGRQDVAELIEDFKGPVADAAVRLFQKLPELEELMAALGPRQRPGSKVGAGRNRKTSRRS